MARVSPVQGVLGLAVLTNTGTDGDALDDAFFVLGPVRSRKLIQPNPSTEAFFFIPGPNRAWKMIHEAAR
jgi:thiamine biosynthesis lipoprotein ApbE